MLKIGSFIQNVPDSDYLIQHLLLRRVKTVATHGMSTREDTVIVDEIAFVGYLKAQKKKKKIQKTVVINYD